MSEKPIIPITARPVVVAPWTEDQVVALNRWQSTHAQPFTCPEHCSTLFATVQGWTCRTCDYRQNWANGFMFAEEPEPTPYVKTKAGVIVFGTLFVLAYWMAR